jgi:hypothetical protein
MTDFFESEMIEVTKREGLNSNLKAKDKTKQVPKGSNNLEAFLLAVEKEIRTKSLIKGRATSQTQNQKTSKW